MNANRSNPYRYDDLLDLPHHVSATHPHMSLLDRAAQFAPFKALTGFEDEVEETARLTDARTEPGEDRIARLDARLRLLEKHLAEAPTVSVTFFRPDSRKDGGRYETVSGTVGKIDPVSRRLVFQSGQSIDIDSIFDVDGALFGNCAEDVGG